MGVGISSNMYGGEIDEKWEGNVGTFAQLDTYAASCSKG
jgi:hypothetical protein